MYSLLIAPEKSDNFLISLWLVFGEDSTIQKTSAMDWLHLSKVDSFVDALGDRTLGAVDAYLGRGQAVGILLCSSGALDGLRFGPAKEVPLVRNFLTVPSKLPVSSYPIKRATSEVRFLAERRTTSSAA